MSYRQHSDADKRRNVHCGHTENDPLSMNEATKMQDHWSSTTKLVLAVVYCIIVMILCGGHSGGGGGGGGDRTGGGGTGDHKLLAHPDHY